VTPNTRTSQRGRRVLPPSLHDARTCGAGQEPRVTSSDRTGRLRATSGTPAFRASCSWCACAGGASLLAGLIAEARLLHERGPRAVTGPRQCAPGLRAATRYLVGKARHCHACCPPGRAREVVRVTAATWHGQRS
jgi:hypothetical protein